MTDSLRVYLHDVVVGEVIRLLNGKIVFTFDDRYVSDPNRATLSQSFIKEDGGVSNRGVVASSGLVPQFFSNLLPEGQLRTYLARIAEVPEHREFDLLELVGSDLPGAVLVQREGEMPSRSDSESFDETTPSKTLRFSLAGVQLKFSAIKRYSGGLTIPAHGVGGDWIVKLPSTYYEGVPKNEYSVMAMAGGIGIDIPEIRLMPMSEIEGLPPEVTDLDESDALIIKRFDRVLGRRIHIEDFAQAIQQRPVAKYNPQVNYTDLTRLVASACRYEDVIDFSRRLMFNNIVGNGDMHLKNWSFIYRDGRTAELSPAYDFLCTTRYIPQDQIGLKMGSTKKWTALTLDDFAAVAEGAGVNKQEFVDAAVDTVKKFHTLWREFTQTLPIDNELKIAIERQMTVCPAITACLPHTQTLRRSGIKR